VLAPVRPRTGMYPATLHEGAGPRTIRNRRRALGSTKASLTLTRCGVRCALASNGRALAVEPGLCGAAPESRRADGAGALDPLGGGVAVPRAGDGVAAMTVVVAGGGVGRGAAVVEVDGGAVGTGGRRTGGTVGGGVVTVGTGVEGTGTGTVGVVTVGTGRVGVVTVGTGRVGTVTVGTSMALPAWVNRCAAAKPTTATARNASLPKGLKPQTSDQQSATTTPNAPHEMWARN